VVETSLKKFQKRNMDISFKTMFIWLMSKVQNTDILFSGLDQDFHLMYRVNIESTWILSLTIFFHQEKLQESQWCRVMKMTLFYLSSLMVSFVMMDLEWLLQKEEMSSRKKDVFIRFKGHLVKSRRQLNRIKSLLQN